MAFHFALLTQEGGNKGSNFKEGRKNVSKEYSLSKELFSFGEFFRSKDDEVAATMPEPQCTRWNVVCRVLRLVHCGGATVGVEAPQ